MTADSLPEAFPLIYNVEAPTEERNRLTTAFRFILAIPHLLIVGGPGVMIGAGLGPFDDRFWFGFGVGGVLGMVALVMAIISWFAIVFTGRQPSGLRNFTTMYLRWRAKAIAYMALLRDEYPPFGEGDYPVQFELDEPPEERNRVTVGFRIILVIPHLLVLFFLGIAWFITAVIGWFAILFTGTYPEELRRFAVGFLRWSLRVESYVLLTHDEYPPFSLE